MAAAASSSGVRVPPGVLPRSRAKQTASARRAARSSPWATASSSESTTTEAILEGNTDNDHGDFIYRWEQAKFDAFSHDFQCFIHFLFPDGSKIYRAFSYDWRLWMAPELRDLLPLFGAQRLTSLGYACNVTVAMPQDAIEPIRRMCRWIVDEECDSARVTPLWELAAPVATAPR